MVPIPSSVYCMNCLHCQHVLTALTPMFDRRLFIATNCSNNRYFVAEFDTSMHTNLHFAWTSNVNENGYKVDVFSVIVL